MPARRILCITKHLSWYHQYADRASNCASGGSDEEVGATHPRRMAFIYVPNGIIMQDWTPRAEGQLGELPSILASMEPHKRDINILSGLTCDKARANGDGGGDHARAGGAFLTGAQPKKTARPDGQTPVYPWLVDVPTDGGKD